MTRAESFADGAEVLVLPLELEGGGSPDDLQIFELLDETARGKQCAGL